MYLANLLVVGVAGGHGAPVDSAAIQVRQLPDDALLPYLGDDAFLYDRQPSALEFWNLFQLWFWEQLEQLGWADAYPMIEDFVLYALLGLGLWLLIRQLFGVHFQGLFYRAAKRPAARVVDSGDSVQGVDFGRRIQDAAAQQNYRLAIRLYYLKSLERLADLELIDWKMDKTNQDYFRELADSSLQQAFAEITRHFEYAWYGDAPLGEGSFQQAEAVFQLFDRQLLSHS